MTLREKLKNITIKTAEEVKKPRVQRVIYTGNIGRIR